MCPITVTRVSYDKGRHENHTLLSLCPEQDARPGHRASTAKVAGTRTGLIQRWRAVQPGRGGRAHWSRRRGQGADSQGTSLAPGWRQEDTGEHSPSLVLFFLASVPPNLPRKDSSFFILGALGVGDRGGAEDICECAPPTAGRGVARRARPRLPRPCLLTSRSGVAAELPTRNAVGPCVWCQAPPPPFVRPQRAGSPESISPINM